MINSIGSTENELNQVYIRMLDYERLGVARQTVQALDKLGKKGCFSAKLYFFHREGDAI
jgi:hypothetical protein